MTKENNVQPCSSTNSEKPVLILKNGATDCRRSEKALSKIIEERMHMNPYNGDIYGFANSKKTGSSDTMVEKG